MILSGHIPAACPEPTHISPVSLRAIEIAGNIISVAKGKPVGRELVAVSKMFCPGRLAKMFHLRFVLIRPVLSLLVVWIGLCQLHPALTLHEDSCYI